MITKQENDKLLGKFIAKKSKLIKKVSVNDYSFDEINISHISQTDNINGNIIHVRYHEEDEISLASRTPEKFNDELINPSYHPPKLVPVDFTEEWLKEKYSSKRKNSSAFENEEHALAEINNKFADILGGDIVLDPSEIPKKPIEEVSENIHMEMPEVGKKILNESIKNKNDIADELENSVDENFSQSETQSNQSDTLSNLDKKTMMSQEASMDMISKKINDFNTPKDIHDVPKSTEEFIPLETDNEEGLKEVDRDSVDKYLSSKELEEMRKRAYEQITSEIDIEGIKDQARSEGYQDGFKQGESKAALSSKAENEKTMAKVGDLVEEFEKLKFNILENVQENFQEVTQAICESVLNREINIDPIKFSDVIQNAIKQTIGNDNFEIRVSPEKFEKLEKIELGNLTGKLISDPDMSDDEFKVESDLTSVSSSIRQIVTELLEKADLNLFDNEEDIKDPKKVG